MLLACNFLTHPSQNLKSAGSLHHKTLLGLFVRYSLHSHRSQQLLVDQNRIWHDYFQFSRTVTSIFNVHCVRATCKIIEIKISLTSNSLYGPLIASRLTLYGPAPPPAPPVTVMLNAPSLSPAHISLALLNLEPKYQTIKVVQ
jgi:hypothetical protein